MLTNRISPIATRITRFILAPFVSCGSPRPRQASIYLPIAHQLTATGVVAGAGVNALLKHLAVTVALALVSLDFAAAVTSSPNVRLTYCGVASPVGRVPVPVIVVERENDARPGRQRPDLHNNRRRSHPQAGRVDIAARLQSTAVAATLSDVASIALPLSSATGVNATLSDVASIALPDCRATAVAATFSDVASIALPESRVTGVPANFKRS